MEFSREVLTNWSNSLVVFRFRESGSKKVDARSGAESVGATIREHDGFVRDVQRFVRPSHQQQKGSQRPTRFVPIGIPHVIVNGQLVVEDSECTGVMSGEGIKAV